MVNCFEALTKKNQYLTRQEYHMWAQTLACGFLISSENFQSKKAYNYNDVFQNTLLITCPCRKDFTFDAEQISKSLVNILSNNENTIKCLFLHDGSDHHAKVTIYAL